MSPIDTKINDMVDTLRVRLGQEGGNAAVLLLRMFEAFLGVSSALVVTHASMPMVTADDYKHMKDITKTLADEQQAFIANIATIMHVFPEHDEGTHKILMQCLDAVMEEMIEQVNLRLARVGGSPH